MNGLSRGGTGPLFKIAVGLALAPTLLSRARVTGGHPDHG
jgi:hypothetical protein